MLLNVNQHRRSIDCEACTDVLVPGLLTRELTVYDPRVHCSDLFVSSILGKHLYALPYVHHFR